MSEYVCQCHVLGCPLIAITLWARSYLKRFFCVFIFYQSLRCAMDSGRLFYCFNLFIEVHISSVYIYFKAVLWFFPKEFKLNLVISLNATRNRSF